MMSASIVGIARNSARCRMALPRRHVDEVRTGNDDGVTVHQ